jgi:hypothetical protein
MKPTFKSVSWTPKDDVCSLLHEYCRSGYRGEGEDRRYVVSINPQNVVRDALHDAKVIPEKQTGCGDYSYWSPGEAVKTSLWHINAAALTSYAQKQGVKKQEVISSCVYEYLTSRPER